MDACHCLAEAILLPSPSLYAHIVSLQRETQWQILRCKWETCQEKASPLGARQPILLMVVSLGL